jgi:hypothetical protein
MVTWYYKDMSSNNDFGLQTAYLSFLASHTGSILYKLDDDFGMSLSYEAEQNINKTQVNMI